MHSRRVSAVAALAATSFVALFALSCGGGGTPSTSTPVTTLKPATPPPTSGGGGTASSSCPLGKGNPSFDCNRGQTVLLPRYESALDTVIQQKPALFNLNDESAPGSKAYKVLDKVGYRNAVVAALQADGMCAEVDIDDPDQQLIFVKDSNDFSEEFDTVTSSGYMRRGGGAYRDTCTPAAFPIDRPADAPPVGSGCFAPYPPPVYQMRCKIHTEGGGVTLLDSTPWVADHFYCSLFGNTDTCKVRPEGWIYNDRVACENWVVGKAKDNGVDGPTWTKVDKDGNETYCTGPASGCANDPDNQYGLLVYSAGTYKVVAKTGQPCFQAVE